MSAFRFFALRSETYVHVGEGQSDEAVDLPVAREQPADLPYFPGSGVKGAHRDAAYWSARIDEAGVEGDVLYDLFGRSGSPSGGGAGRLDFSECRVLALPIRSTLAPFLWITSPNVISRMVSNLERCGPDSTLAPTKNAAQVLLDQFHDDMAICSREELESVRLEHLEMPCERAPELATFCAALGELFPGMLHRSFSKNLVMVSDQVFAWLSQFALPVRARNNLDPNKVSLNLWYEEYLPPDTILWSLIGSRVGRSPDADIELLKQALASEDAERHYLQIGGNETIGQGWCRLFFPGIAT